MEILIIATLFWKRFIRSFNKNKLVNILSYLSYGYFIFLLLFAGISLSIILNGKALNYFFCFYFLFDFGVRLFFQKIYGDALEFDFLPVRRVSLVHFTLVRNIFNPFNLIPLLLFVPIFLKLRNFPVPYVLTLVELILLINWIVLFLKIADSIIVKVATSMVFFGMISSIYLWIFDAIDMDFLANNKLVILIGLVLNGFLYGLSFTLVKKYFLRLRNVYLVKSMFQFGNIRFVGELVTLEIKLILRNKRALTYIGMSLVLIFCFERIAHFQHDLSLSGVFFFSTLSIITPVFYSQYLFSWESEYFGCILCNTQNALYISSKFKLLNILIFLNAVCLTPLVFSTSFNYYFLCVWVFQLGILPFVILLISLNNDQPLSLSKGAFLNYEGTSINTFIIILLGLLLPMIIYVPFHLLEFPSIGVYMLAVLGIIGLILRKRQIQIIENYYARKKYSMYDGFKNR